MMELAPEALPLQKLVSTMMHIIIVTAAHASKFGGNGTATAAVADRKMLTVMQLRLTLKTIRMAGAQPLKLTTQESNASLMLPGATMTVHIARMNGENLTPSAVQQMLTEISAILSIQTTVIASSTIYVKALLTVRV